MFESLIPRGTMGRPEEICDGRAVSCFRRSELREWEGICLSTAASRQSGSAGNQESASQHCSVA
jgi:hypothetical protein